MTDTLTVRKNEVGVVRIFAVDLPADRIEAFEEKTTTDGKTVWPVAQALGAEHLDRDGYDLFDVAALDELGLAGLLIHGHGIAEADVAPMRPQLEALHGHVLVLTSRAVNAGNQTLHPKSPLRWIATFSEDRTPVSFEPLPNPDPQAIVEDPPTKPVPSNAAISGRIAALVLILMGLLVLLIIRMAG